MKNEIVRKLQKAGFIPISQMSREEYLPFQEVIECSDLTYSNLFAYEQYYHYMVKQISSCLVITGINENNNLSSTLIPLNKEEVPMILNNLYEMFEKLELPLTLNLMSEQYMELFKKHPLVKNIEYSMDYSDYVYDISDFVDLEGGKNSKKRRHMNNVAKNIPNCRFEVIDNLYEKEKIIFDILNSWCEKHDCNACVYGCEKEVINKMLHADFANRLYAGVLYIGDEAEMFAIGEIINDTYYLYFKKSKNNIDGTFYYFEYYLLKQIQHISFVNYEEDMGLPGLRTYKSRRHPIRMIDKYTIILKGSKYINSENKDKKENSCGLIERKAI